MVYHYAKAAFLKWEVEVSHGLSSGRQKASRIFGLSIFETAPDETAPETFFRSLHSLKQLRTLSLDSLCLNTDQYVTILFTSSIQRLVLQRVYLWGKPPEGPTKSQITELELHWDHDMGTLTNQLFSDLEEDLEWYTLHMRALSPVESIIPRSPRLKSLKINCRGVNDNQAFLSSLIAYIGGATSLSRLTVDTDAFLPLTRQPSTLPRILRLHLRPFDLSFGHWTAGSRLDLLDVTQDPAGLSRLDRIVTAVASSDFISEFRLRVAWSIRNHALRRFATQHLPVTKLVVQTVDRDTSLVPIPPSRNEEQWTGVERIDIIVAWNRRWMDLDDVRNFRRWVEEHVEDGKSRIQNASFDIWRSPICVWRAFDYEKDEVLWWETWDSLSRCWECPGDRDLTCLREAAIPW